MAGKTTSENDLPRLIISQNTLQDEGFDNESILDQAIKKLDNDVKKAKRKEANEADELEVSAFPVFLGKQAP